MLLEKVQVDPRSEYRPRDAHSLPVKSFGRLVPHAFGPLRKQNLLQ